MDKPMRVVAMTAAVTALVSGVIGAAINAYVVRARPQLTITSVGFRGPLRDAPIPVPDEVVAMSTDSGWTSSLDHFETYEKLVKAEQYTSETLEELKQSLRSLEAWKKQSVNLPKTIDAANDAALELLKQHPLLKDEVFEGATLLLIRRRAIGAPPETKQMLIGRPAIFDIYFDQKNPAWLVHLGGRMLRIPIDKMPDSVSSQLELLALSVSRASLPNIEFYSTKTAAESNTGMNDLVALRDALRTLVLPKACLSVVINIHNTGSTAVTFRPFFALRLLHPEYRTKPYVVAIDAPRDDPKAQGSPSASIPRDEVDGKRVLVQPYLPETSSAPYIVIPANETREISLVGTDPLGGDATGIKAIHGTGLLRCQIIGTTLAGKNFNSSPAAFTEKVDEDERKRLASLRASE